MGLISHCSVTYGIDGNCERMLHKHMKEGTQLDLERVGTFRGHMHNIIILCNNVSYTGIQLCYLF